MSDTSADMLDSQGSDARLAQWLTQLLTGTQPVTGSNLLPVGEDASLLGADYHPAFYVDIPDFALALLQNDSTLSVRYAPLLFHLIGCPTCHRAYLETYDALKMALGAETTAPPATAHLRLALTAAAATTPPKLLVLLCQLLIGQARAVLRQAHRERTDEDAWARSLLRQAVQLSRYIMQNTLRQRALRDLVEVASLSRPPDAPPPENPPTLSYAALVGSGSGARGRRVRRAEMASRPQEQAEIELRAGNLFGSVTQEDDMLILRLVNLADALRGKSLLISIPLGTLLEPVRWLGGNPYAIRSAGLVGPDGTLVTPLGRTDLRLNNPEERNLLETLFKKLDVRSLEA